MSAENQQIMVVDDHEASLSGLSKILGKWGYKVITAENGKIALAKLKDTPCKLVLTDLQMPEMNGIQFLKEIRQVNPQTGVIIITAYGEVDTYLEAMNLGALEYLNKPIRPYELKATISKVLENMEKSQAG